MNRFRALACVLLFACVGAAFAEPESPAERREIRQRVVALLGGDDFLGLRQLWQQYRDTTQRTASGVSRMRLFDDAVDDFLDGSRETPEDFHKHWVAVTKGWVEQYPKEPLAVELHVRALRSYAFYFRGFGLGNTVARESWATFGEQIRLAGDFLASHAAVGQGDAGWYVALLQVGRAAGWPRPLMERVTDEGLAKYPDDFRLYNDSLVYRFPKWGGSAQEIDDFINRAAKLAPRKQGMEFYARLYSGAGEEQYAHALYSASKIEWAKMKQGLEDMVARYPSAWNRNVLTYNACIAGDKATAAKALREIGPAPELAAWKPNAQGTFDSCVAWANQP